MYSWVYSCFGFFNVFLSVVTSCSDHRWKIPGEVHIVVAILRFCLPMWPEGRGSPFSALMHQDYTQAEAF
jgi:hypothetical protein